MIMGADTQLTRPCQHCQQDICAVHELLPHTPCSHRPSPLPRYHPLSSSSLSLHDSSSHCSWSKSSTRCPSPRTHHPRTCPIIKVHECPQSLHTLLCRRVLLTVTAFRWRISFDINLMSPIITGLAGSSPIVNFTISSFSLSACCTLHEGITGSVVSNDHP